jgi:peptidoglycan/LPS O-acetylase OafA/YrhL
MLSFGVFKPGLRLKPIAAAIIAIIAIPGILMIFTSEWNDRYMFLAGYTLMALGSAAMILLAVSPGSDALKGLLSFRPLVWIGSVSYGVYLWHYPIFAYFEGLELPRIFKLAAMWGVVFAVAGLSYYGLERPFLRMKQRFQKQP